MAQTKVIINETEKDYQVKFQPFSMWLVRSIKQLGFASYRPNGKYWSVPKSSWSELLSWASNYQHEITKDEVYGAVKMEVPPMPELDAYPPIRTDKRKLFPYQEKGIAYLKEHPRTIVGDEPGLGKTVQAIAAVEAMGCKCVLVICPATLKRNWINEIQNIWTEHRALELTDRLKNTWHLYREVGMTKYFVVNFESLKKFFVDKIHKPEGQPLKLAHIEFNARIQYFDAVIIDEIHRCKDGNTQQAKFVMGITMNKLTVIALTGTPVVNTPKDLVAQLHIIGKLSVFGGYKQFVQRYCKKGVHKNYLQELNMLMLSNCFYRRLKKDVLTELPDKMRRVVRCDITTREEYNKAEEKLRLYLRENLNKTDAEITKAMRGEVMVQLSILKQISARGKMPFVIEQAKQVIEAGEKLVLFAWHKEIVKEVRKAFPEALTITGDDSIDDREKAVNRFQNDPEAKLIILNIKSGGVGITLTASSRVGFIELPWHPADADQCEDRCHRIGQADSVDCSYFLGHNTVDEWIYQIINEKRKLVSATIGSDEIETSVVDEFINLFSNSNPQQQDEEEPAYELR